MNCIGAINGINPIESKAVITHKPIQTGNVDVSEDIVKHRAIMGCGLLPVDEQKLTMPQLFPYPCSPHLASRLGSISADFRSTSTSMKLRSSSATGAPRRNAPGEKAKV